VFFTHFFPSNRFPEKMPFSRFRMAKGAKRGRKKRKIKKNRKKIEKKFVFGLKKGGYRVN